MPQRALSMQDSVTRYEGRTREIEPPPRDAAGFVELRLRTSRGHGLRLLMAMSVVWNGFVVFLVSLSMSFSARGEIGISVFLVCAFGAIGLLLIAITARAALRALSPHPWLYASMADVPLGEQFELRRHFPRAGRITRLDLTLEGREEATYTRGTSSQTDSWIFARQVIVATTLAPEIIAGRALVNIPGGLMHSLDAPNNRVIWILKVVGKMRFWPSVNEEFPIRVLPLAEEV